jgi:hypothetical protein
LLSPLIGFKFYQSCNKTHLFYKQFFAFFWSKNLQTISPKFVDVLFIVMEGAKKGCEEPATLFLTSPPKFEMEDSISGGLSCRKEFLL